MGIQISQTEALIIILAIAFLFSIAGFILGFLAHWILKSFHRSWVWGCFDAGLGLILAVGLLVSNFILTY